MMKKYDKYKNSGVEWTGEVPDHWKKLKIGRSFNKIGSGTTPKSGSDTYYEEGTINWLNTGDLNDSFITETSKKITEAALNEFSTLKIYPKDSIVIALYGATIGKLGQLKIETTTNQACCVLSDSNEILNRYLFYYFLSAREYIISKSYGGGQPNISQDLIKQLYVSAPTIKEQTQIALYLDHQTSIIDQLIQQKEKLIELLKEKRQAVINEAVTKGLNPKVKMKDSGIEWLGEVPEGWELRNLEVVARRDRYSITGGPFGSDLKNEEYTDDGVRIIQLQNIGVGEFRDDYKIYTSEEKADYLFSSNIYPGEIIIAKMADPVARACIIPDFANRFIMASDGIRLEVDKLKHNTKYIEYSINSKYFNYQAELNSTGTTRLRIGLTTLKKLKLLLPKLEEQNRIVEFLESYNNYFLETSEKLETQIEKFKEYRQSIISEAVTGKIDVRDWQPNKQQVA